MSEIEKYTILEISDQFEEAIYTLKRLPPVKRQGFKRAWPHILHSTNELMNAQKTPMRLPPPSSASIDRLEECMTWILWLEDETQRRIIWLRAERVYWKQICARVGYGRTKAWEIYTMGLLRIVTQLNARQMARLHVRTKNY